MCAAELNPQHATPAVPAPADPTAGPLYQAADRCCYTLSELLANLEYVDPESYELALEAYAAAARLRTGLGGRGTP